MTAEIAVLNKEAVALAADSAVTISLPNGYKILPSANKIFSLSKYHPVGVMIYGNAQLGEVPWEVIIKEYRRGLRTNSFATLKDYAENFIDYLSTSTSFFTATSQERALLLDAQQVFANVLYAYEEGLSSLAALHRTEGKVPPTAEDEAGLLESAILKWYNPLKDLQPLPTLPAGFGARVRKTYGREIRALVRQTFEDVPLTRSMTDRLVSTAIWYVERVPVRARPGYSGLVIAGFGENDVFAGLRSFSVAGVVLDTLVYTDEHDVSITGSTPSAVLAFAQDEMVSAFMEGIDRRFMGAIHDGVEGMLTALTDAAGTISGLGSKKLKAFRSMLERGRAALLKEFSDQVLAIQQEHFTGPVVRVTAMLPKTELAAMAEALVSLTSFKRKVSEQAETVGGPIDVAVISKGDGFIWVKRKHYFTSDLNPQFFANYYREDADAKQDP